MVVVSVSVLPWDPCPVCACPPLGYLSCVCLSSPGIPVLCVSVLPWDPCPVCVSLLCLALYPKSTLKLFRVLC